MYVERESMRLPLLLTVNRRTAAESPLIRDKLSTGSTRSAANKWLSACSSSLVCRGLRNLVTNFYHATDIGSQNQSIRR